MVTREDLQRLQTYNERLRSLEQQKERIRDAVTNMTQRMTGMPHGSDGHDRMMEFVARLDELESQFDALIVQQAELRLKVERALTELPEQQERVLRLRYIDACSWRQVARWTHYDERHLRRIHNAALARLSGL